MKAEIISIGDELLIGQVINTNQAFIAEQLNSVGITVDRMTTVGDEELYILSAFEQAWHSHDVVTVTGGLGPTHDDITRAVVCKFFNTDLEVNKEALENIRRIFERRKLPLTPLNEDQARVPRGCRVIPNTAGTAPGYFFEREGKFFIVMPGVPFEMKAMMESFVLPFFASYVRGSVIRHRTLKTTGIPESFLAERIGETATLFPPHSGITLAYLPSPLGVRLRISVRAASSEEAITKIQDVEKKLYERVGHYIYGTDTEELETVVGRILTEQRRTISVAESCTGGLLAHRLTNIPGSSAYFERGYITYSNTSKHFELGVPLSLLQNFGAVSKEVAEAMAFGVRTKANTDIGISITGIAGPTGGTEQKPVGLVWIGYSDEKETCAYRYLFNGERLIVKERAVQAALELLRRKLLSIPLK